MNLGLSPLLVEKTKLDDAKHTMHLAMDAAKRGDTRLAVSRAITAAVQASRVSCFAKDNRTLVAADDVIQRAREVIQGIALKKVMIRKVRR